MKTFKKEDKMNIEILSKRFLCLAAIILMVVAFSSTAKSAKAAPETSETESSKLAGISQTISSISTPTSSATAGMTQVLGSTFSQMEQQNNDENALKAIETLMIKQQEEALKAIETLMIEQEQEAWKALEQMMIEYNSDALKAIAQLTTQQEDNIWPTTAEEWDLLYAIVRQEAGENEYGAWAVAQSMRNRIDDATFGRMFPRTIMGQATARYQYTDDTGLHLRYLNGNYTDAVIRGVQHVVNGEKLHNFCSYRTTGSPESGVITGDRIDIGGNTFFRYTVPFE